MMLANLTHQVSYILHVHRTTVVYMSKVVLESHSLLMISEQLKLLEPSQKRHSGAAKNPEVFA
jgi:hypothetical protein